MNGISESNKNSISMNAKNPLKKTKAILIAVGGPTCSGKTTLAKHLRKILPNSFILHQDDFAPPSDQIPIHPIHNLPDWDSPEGAIDWPRFRKILKDFHQDPNTPLPPSHDNLNIQPDVKIDLSGQISEKIEAIKKSLNVKDDDDQDSNYDYKFIIVDGFLLYWDKECVEEYDVKLFVRESYDVLKERRRIRQMYNTADGQTWVDPPEYWDKIIWPAYLLAHQHMFDNQDAIKGKLDTSSWAGNKTIVLQPAQGDLGPATMTNFVARALEATQDHLKSL